MKRPLTTICSKRQYHELSRAKTVFEQKRRAKTLHKYSVIYWCQTCNAWHIGRLPKPCYSVYHFVRTYTKQSGTLPSLKDIEIGMSMQHGTIKSSLTRLKNQYHMITFTDFNEITPSY